MVDTTTRLGHGCSAPASYGWPVRPFHRAHAIRGSFGDPRVGLAPNGIDTTYSFHTGVDVVAADGTPVYATLTGSVVVESTHPDVVWVRDRRGTVFSYWHVTPAVRTGDHVTAYETIVGHVEKPWGHVHFSESREGQLLNPLRAGAMGPYVDRTAPQVASVTLEQTRTPFALAGARGSLDVIAEVGDAPAHPIARPWNDLPVMPALVRWRLVGQHGAGTPWATAVDFTNTIPSGDSYGRIYAQWTRQNHPWEKGRYRVYLSHALDSRSLPNGRYRVEVAVSDMCGNRSDSSAWINVDNASAL